MSVKLLAEKIKKYIDIYYPRKKLENVAEYFQIPKAGNKVETPSPHIC
jgi:hypothetical protein